jgi:hypothetical protein
MALGGFGIAHAVPLYFDFTGEVTFTSAEPNVFGLTVDAPNNTISGWASITDADLTGAHTYTPAEGGLEMAFHIGEVSYLSTQDLGFPYGPILSILDGQFVDLLFTVFDFEFNLFAMSGGWAADQYFGETTVAGTFEVATPTAVPAPGTLALLAFGLLLLSASTWRRRLPVSRA